MVIMVEQLIDMNKSIWSHEASLKYRGGPPLRTPESVANIIFDLANNVISNKPNTKILLLGVTPEIALLPWNKNITLTAFDKSKEAISVVWQNNPNIQSTVQQGDWLTLPLEDQSVACAIGDGCNTQLDHMNLYPTLFNELKRVLNKEGVVITRIFIRPELPGSFKEIVKSTFEGKIQYFGTLKWKIAMTLAEQSKKSEVKVAQILETFEDLFPNRDELLRCTDWTKDIINTIDVYKNSHQSYTFPTLNEFKKTIHGIFEITEIKYDTHELAECCPIISLKASY